MWDNQNTFYLYFWGNPYTALMNLANAGFFIFHSIFIGKSP